MLRQVLRRMVKSHARMAAVEEIEPLDADDGLLHEVAVMDIDVSSVHGTASSACVFVHSCSRSSTASSTMGSGNGSAAHLDESRRCGLAASTYETLNAG